MSISTPPDGADTTSSALNGELSNNPDMPPEIENMSHSNISSSNLPAGSPGPTQADGLVRDNSGANIFVTMASLCLSVTLSALDLTIVTTALPAIVSDFGSGSGYIWIGGAYILAYTAILPIWGAVANIWGRKPIMMIAVAVFFVGSVLCATVRQPDAFIAARAVQGLGAAGMGVMVNVVIADMFSLRERGLYLAITSIFYAIASAVGPVLGGVFTNQLK